MTSLFHRVAGAVGGALLMSLCAGAAAHDGQAGDVAIRHPFATPSLAGSSNGAAYFVMLENTGSKADKLLRASTPVAARVELHSMAVDAQGVMRMREIDAIELPVKAQVRMRPGLGLHLMLVGLREPLKEGATFPMTLEFERGGRTEVKVVVQTPRPRDAASAGHMH
ncbi:MAG: copper chaperone PCu(A)C [Caldimonas sp.]